MDVTRFNADVIVEQFRQCVAECEFYAVDQEMTGISVPGMKEHAAMDLAELYPSRRAAATRYSAFQFGVALFTRAPPSSPDSKPTYVVRPFNFYIRSDVENDDVVLNISAVKFLLSNHMNFQKWLVNGMAYASKSKEAEEYKKLFPEKPEELTEEEREWVQRTVAVVREWVDRHSAGAEPAPSAPVSMNLGDECFKPRADVALHYALKEGGLLRRVVVSPPLDSAWVRGRRAPTTLRLASEKEAKEAHRDEQSRRVAIHNDRIGFRRFWNVLVESKKRQIGHTYSSDLMFMMNMHSGMLPLPFSQFKEEVHQTFAEIVDTKTLSAAYNWHCNQYRSSSSPSAEAAPSSLEQPPFPKTSLEPLFQEVVRRYGASMTFHFPFGFESYHPRCVKANPEAAAHQAAFDAYMTGVVYALLRDHFPRPGGVEQWLNLITVFGSSLLMNLSGEDHHGDVNVFVLRVPVAAGGGRNAPRPNREAARALLLTEAQEIAIASAEAAKAATGKYTAPALDLWVDVLDKDLSSEDSVTFVVAFTPDPQTPTVKSVEDVVQRLQSAAKRRAAAPSQKPSSQAEDEKVGGKRSRCELAESFGADPSQITVSPYAAWKDDSKKIRSRSSSSLSQQ